MKTMKMTQQQIDDWNKKNPLGTRCALILDDGTALETKTRSSAWIIAVDLRTGAGIPMVKVEGKSAGWHLARVKPL